MEVPSSEGVASFGVAKCPCGAQALCMVVILVARVLYSVPEAQDLQASCSASHNSQRGIAGGSLEVASLLQLLLRAVISTCETAVLK